MCVHGYACGHMDRQANCLLPANKKCPIEIAEELEAMREASSKGQKKDPVEQKEVKTADINLPF